MADTEETPAQRQARIRRQKREAKITGTASERLDKITRLSGRAPETSMFPVRLYECEREALDLLHASHTPRTGADSLLTVRDEPQAPTLPATSTSPQQIPPPNVGAAPSLEQSRAQEEYLKAVLRQPMPQQGQGQTQPEEDPMMKMFQAMMGGLNGSSDPNAPDGMAAGIGISPDDVSKATGLPPFLTNMMMGNQKAQPNPAEVQATRRWRIVHTVFAALAGLYLVFSVSRSSLTFGENPPAPATFQNPFVIFLTGQVLVQSVRVLSTDQSGKIGLGLWMQMGKEFIGDGAIMVFMLGLASWWNGTT